MKYVDGFVVAVPAENKEAYIAMAAKPFDGKRMIYGGFSPIMDD